MYENNTARAKLSVKSLTDTHTHTHNVSVEEYFSGAGECHCGGGQPHIGWYFSTVISHDGQCTRKIAHDESLPLLVRRDQKI